ncbi:MAG: hypothetical protein WAM73_17590 [Desulfobacterales bacterium]
MARKADFRGASISRQTTATIAGLTVQNSGTSYVAHEHDRNGNMIQNRRDEDYNGATPQWDYEEIREYDEANRLSEVTQDYGFDGVAEYQYTFAYDEFGNVAESTNFDGTISRRFTITWEQRVTPGYDTWFAPMGGELGH